MTSKWIVYLAGVMHEKWQQQVIDALPFLEFINPAGRKSMAPSEFTAWDLSILRRRIRESDVEKMRMLHGLAKEIQHRVALQLMLNNVEDFYNVGISFLEGVNILEVRLEFKHHVVSEFERKLTEYLFESIAKELFGEDVRVLPQPSPYGRGIWIDVAYKETE